MKTFIKRGIFTVQAINKLFPTLTSVLFTIICVVFAEQGPAVEMTVGGLTPQLPAFTLTRRALTRGSAGLDPVLTTAMWLFVQPTCPELNTDGDRGGMATSFYWK